MKALTSSHNLFTVLAARYLDDSRHAAHTRQLGAISRVEIAKRLSKSPQARGETMHDSMAAASSRFKLAMRRTQSYLRMKGCCSSCVAVHRFLGSCSTAAHACIMQG